jgi:hypothetical protein
MLNPLILNSSEFFIAIIAICSIIAVSYIRLTGNTPGGIIPVGATLILALRNPLWALFCFFLSFLGYWLYLLVVVRLDKRGDFPHVYSIGVITMIIGLLCAYQLQVLGVLNMEGMTIGGLIIPAILANQYRLQGYSSTLKGYFFCVIVSALTVEAILFALSMNGLIDAFFFHFKTLHISAEERYIKFFPLVSLLSLIYGFFIYRKAGIRSGGYIMSPLAAQLLTSANATIILASGMVVLYLAQVLLTRFTFIIGLQRYLATIILSSIYVWLSIVFIQDHLSSLDARFFGSAWIIVLVLASYSTDTYVYRSRRAGLFVGINLLSCYLLILSAQALPFLRHST